MNIRDFNEEILRGIVIDLGYRVSKVIYKVFDQMAYYLLNQGMQEGEQV